MKWMKPAFGAVQPAHHQCDLGGEPGGKLPYVSVY